MYWWTGWTHFPLIQLFEIVKTSLGVFTECNLFLLSPRVRWRASTRSNSSSLLWEITSEAVESYTHFLYCLLDVPDARLHIYGILPSCPLFPQWCCVSSLNYLQTPGLPQTERSWKNTLRLGPDSKTFQVLVNGYTEKSLCPPKRQPSLPRSCAAKMKSSLLNLPRANALNYVSLSIVHWVQGAHGGQICLVCDWSGSERGYLSHPGRGTFLHSWIQSLSDLFIT